MENQIDDIKKTIDRMESDLAFDRSELDKVKHEIQTMKSQLQTIIDRMPRWENKVTDAVQDALEPIHKAVQESAKAKNKVSFWKRFFKGGDKHGS